MHTDEESQMNKVDQCSKIEVPNNKIVTDCNDDPRIDFNDLFPRELDENKIA